MNLEVKIDNLGAIKSANIDIKPLTVFIGKNNTGKTWASTAICGLLDDRSLNTITRTIANEPERLTHRFDELADIAKILSEQKTVSVDLVKFVSENFDKYFDTLSEISREWLNPMIGTSKPLFDETKLYIKPNTDSDKIKKAVLEVKIDETFYSNPSLPKIRVMKDSDNPNLFIFIQESKDTVALPFAILKEVVYKLLISAIHDFASGNVYYLPAERTGLVTFINQFHQQPLVNNDIGEEPVTPPELNSQPINTLISRLKMLQNPEIEKSLLLRQYNTNQNEYAKLAELIEKDVMDGEVFYELTPDAKSQNLHYKLNSNPELSLEMAAVSSTVKDLVPLVMYLRYFLQKGDRLLIDEPEMNLHPENQARLMEFITLLVNSGINVIMVTHSPYMVNHLESLILAQKGDIDDNIVDNFYLKNRNAFIDAENLSIYLFEDGTAKNILNNDGIDLSTYDNVAEKLTNIYVEV